MKTWIVSVLIMALALQVLLFWPRPVADQDIVDELDGKSEALKHYINLLEQRNELQRKRNEILRLQILHAKGELWSS